MTEPVRLCKDCRWAVNLVADRGGPLPSALYFECHHPSAKIIEPRDLVTGAPGKEVWDFCSHARSPLKKHQCGPEGRFWQPIEVGFGPKL